MPAGLTRTRWRCEDAKEKGVQVSAVNIMAMDYGTYYDGNMGEYADQAATATQKQVESGPGSATRPSVEDGRGHADDRRQRLKRGLRPDDATELRKFAEGKAWPGSRCGPPRATSRAPEAPTTKAQRRPVRASAKGGRVRQGVQRVRASPPASAGLPSRAGFRGPPVGRGLQPVGEDPVGDPLRLRRRRACDQFRLARHHRVERLLGDLRGIILPRPVASAIPALRKKSVSVAPGMNDVIVTPVSATSSCNASAKDCTNDFEAL